MSLGKIAGLYLFVPCVVFLLASPSFAEKEAISDQELDRVTAAGICRGDSGTCDASDQDSAAAQASGITQDRSGQRITTTTTNILDLNQAQQAMRTVILNNIVGDSQVANGINVSGGARR